MAYPIIFYREVNKLGKTLDTVKANEIFQLEQLGFVEAGTEAGTHKLSAKGIAEVTRILESLPAKEKVILKLQLAGNEDTDLKSLF